MIKSYAADNEELLRRVKEGDIEAREKLIVENMGLVYNVVKRFSGRGYDDEDLVQIGSIGLIRAVERFDLAFEVKFSTYAVPMIIGEIKRFIRDDGIIKVSRSLKELSYNASKVREKLIRERGDEPTVTQIAEEMKVSTAELSLAIESQVQPQSIYESFDNGKSEGACLADRLESNRDDIGLMVNRITVRQILSELSERDKLLMHMRYFKMKTQAETAEVLGLSQVQVSRLEKKILTEMRKKLKSD